MLLSANSLCTNIVARLRMLLSHLIILSLALLTFAVSHTATARPQQSVSLQLKWSHQFQFAGYYIAQEKGYYKQAGLDVTIIEGGAGKNIYQSVLKKRANFGVASGGDALRLYLKGLPIKSLGVIYQHSPYALLTLKSSPYLSPSDLTKAPIMIASEQGEVEILSMFANEGIDIGKLNIVPHRWNYDDLLEGKIGAMSVYSTTAPYQLNRLDTATRLLKPVEYGIDFYGDIIIASKTEVDRFPERSEAFLQASLAD